MNRIQTGMKEIRRTFLVEGITQKGWERKVCVGPHWAAGVCYSAAEEERGHRVGVMNSRRVFALS